jgi:hypothetical protein
MTRYARKAGSLVFIVVIAAGIVLAVQQAASSEPSPPQDVPTMPPSPPPWAPTPPPPKPEGLSPGREGLPPLDGGPAPGQKPEVATPPPVVFGNVVVPIPKGATYSTVFWDTPGIMTYWLGRGTSYVGFNANGLIESKIDSVDAPDFEPTLAAIARLEQD